MLVVQDQRKLVIATAMGAEITEVIPHAKSFTMSGEHLTAVRHGVEESLVLRNLGFKKTPAPILSYYNWPSRYTAMEHQKQTSAFMTMNKKALVLNAPGCVDADTEYLSPAGWVRISEYESGQVAQFNPNTGKVTFVFGRYVKLPCTEMVRVKTKYGVDQLLSPEHRCLVYGKRSPAEKREVLTAAELARRERASIPRSSKTIAFAEMAIKTTFAFDGVGIPLSDEEIRVQVALIADGHFPSPSGERCIIRIKKERKKERLRRLLGAAGISFTERQRDYPTAVGFSVFTFTAPIRTKCFDPHWYAASAAQLRIIYDEVQHWDSCVSANPNRGWRFNTYVKESADFIQFACAATGNTARVLEHSRVRRGKLKVEYVVQVRPGVEMVGLHGGSSDNVTAPAVSSDGYKYCFMVPTTFLLLRRNGCVFTTGNTGKSLSALWAADFLIQEGVAKRVLIIAPLSTVKVVWGKELRHHLPHRSFELLTGSKEQRLRRLQTPGTQFFIVNHDGFAVIQNELTALGVDVVIYDELTAVKTPGSQRFRRMYNWTHANDVWFWGMTGTPISQSPVDAWTMAKIVDSPNVPKSFTAFRDLVMTKVSTFRWVPRPEALDICHRVLQPSVRYSLEDCTEIPDTLYLGHECQMSVEQIRSFKEMKERAVLLSHDVSAPNMAVALSKMLQICGGYVLGNADTGVKLDFTGRYDTLKEVVDEIGDKVIVFVPFRGMQKALLDLFIKDGYDAVIVNGDVTGAKRNKIFDDFQNSEKIRVLLAHPKVAAHGLTLTRSRDVIWYLPVYSLEMYEQACARIRRIGTKGKTRVHHLHSTSFERELYSRLQSKRRVLADFLELIQGVNED